MATEKFVEAIARQIDRRNFIKQLGTSTLGALLALMGLSQTAFALVPFKCCSLCFNPGPSCYDPNCPTDVVPGSWCWTCAYGGQTWRCCECKYANADCADNCYGVYASSAECVGGPCPQTPVH